MFIAQRPENIFHITYLFFRIQKHTSTIFQFTLSKAVIRTL